MGLFDWLSGRRRERAPPPPASSQRPAQAPAAARLPAFLAGLVAQSRAPLTRADFETSAARLGCEWEALAAAVEVESSPVGAFGPDGRLLICYEKHLFSRKTGGRFDASHPDVSGRSPTAYPAAQSERWEQLAAAFALDAEAALQSTSFGRFQILGQYFAQLGLANAHDYVAKLARSERDQLEAFEAFVRTMGLADELQRKDWVGFASRYNGPSYAGPQLDAKMAEAYRRLKSNPVA